jgi:hypothetical protein
VGINWKHVLVTTLSVIVVIYLLKWATSKYNVPLLTQVVQAV